jgi:predicted dehydrogenase
VTGPWPRRAIALVGCGRWGRNILRDLLALGAAVTVVDPDVQARAAARVAGAGAALAELDGLGAVDGAVVATPTSSHAAAIEVLLARAVSVFCEKPLTAEPRSAALLAARAGEHLFVMDKWRYHPGVEALAALARSGELGPVIGLRTTRLGGHAHADVDAVWILAPHDLSIGLEILGALPEPRAAVAEPDSDGRGAVGLIGVLGERPWHVLEVSATAVEWRREIRLHCRDGVAVLADAESPQLSIHQRDGIVTTRPLDGEWPLRRELRAFLAHLAGGPPPRSSATEGAAIVAAPGGAAPAGGTGRRVTARIRAWESPHGV